MDSDTNMDADVAVGFRKRELKITFWKHGLVICELHSGGNKTKQPMGRKCQIWPLWQSGENIFNGPVLVQSGFILSLEILFRPAFYQI